MSGEHPKGREALDKLTRRAVEHGADPRWAKEKARKAIREIYHGEKSERPRGHRQNR